jgi:tetratricopeptide (TPR) repeat protein
MALFRLGRPEDALAALDRAADLDPGYALTHYNRGVVLFDIRRFNEAVDAQLAALACTAPASEGIRASILYHLARAGRKAGRFAAVEAAARAELGAGHTDIQMLEQVALVLDDSTRPREATELRNDLARRTGARRSGRTDGVAMTVLLLGAVGAGHVPTRYLLDLKTFAAVSVSLLSRDQADAPLGSIDIEALRSADVIFSTLADADHDCRQFAAAADLCASLNRPVLKPPGQHSPGPAATAPPRCSGTSHGDANRKPHDPGRTERPHDRRTPPGPARRRSRGR